MIKRSCKGTPALALLEQYLVEYDTNPNISRTARTIRAIELAVEFKEPDWLSLGRELKAFKRRSITDTENLAVPAVIQITIEDEEKEAELMAIEARLKEIFQATTAIRTSFLLEILWLSYLKMLKRFGVGVVKPQSKADSDLTAPDMAKWFVTLLLNNKESDKPVIEEIKRILLKWKEDYE